MQNTFVEAQITAFSHDGRGIVRLNGKTTFIEGALLGETVRFVYQKKRRQFDEGIVVEVLQASSERVTPGCEHYNICGGCQLQHMSVAAQHQLKQNAFLEQLKAIADISPGHLLPPIAGNPWNYRRRARLGAKYVNKKERMLVGFREKKGAYLADIQSCKVLASPFNQLIQPLQDLLQQLHSRQHIPQIEIAASDTQAVLIIRHMIPLSESDLAHLNRFAQAHKLYLYLQPSGLDSNHRIWPRDSATQLEYALKDGIKLQFEPWDFVQINAQINQQMVKKALELLMLSASDRVLELFCGLGNFSLAIAKHCEQVVAVEGSAQLIERAVRNAQYNGIENVDFHVANLFNPLETYKWARNNYTSLLIDPPRSGALEIMPYLTTWRPQRIVYVSCNPATLARDARLLVEQGYDLYQAGLLDMFPHTRHSEWICLFIKR